MKKSYDTPVMEMITLETEDIMSTSGNGITTEEGETEFIPLGN